MVGQERPEISSEKGERLCSTCFTPKEKIAEAWGAEQSTSSESSSSEGISDEDI